METIIKEVELRIEVIRKIKCRITSPNDIENLIKNEIGNCDREVLYLVCLDTKNQVTCVQKASIGSLNQSILSVREILKTAIISNSMSIVIAHNHPSGDSTPSSDDINATQGLQKACNIMGITLLDHIIIGLNGNTSLRKKGFL